MSWAAQLAMADAAMLKAMGETVTYTPGVGAAVPVTGVYEEQYLKADAGEAGAASAGPAVFFRLADLPSDPRTDTAATVTIRGLVRKPYSAEPDGTGGVLLRLHYAT